MIFGGYHTITLIEIDGLIVKALLKISIIAFQKKVKKVSISMKIPNSSALFLESNIIPRCRILS